MRGVIRGEEGKRAESLVSVSKATDSSMDGHTLIWDGYTGSAMKVFVDLFCGLGGASEAFVGTDWRVIRIDNNPDLTEHVKGMWVLDMMKPVDVLETLTGYLHGYGHVTEMVVWASPPCINFSDADPERDEKDHDLTLLNNTVLLIGWLNDRFNVTSYWIENVRGAIRSFTPVLGDYRQRIGPFFLWGRFVPIACITAEVHRHRKPFNKTNSRTHLRSNIHAKIPYALSKSVLLTVERQLSLLEWVE